MYSLAFTKLRSTDIFLPKQRMDLFFKGSPDPCHSFSCAAVSKYAVHFFP